MIHHAHAAVPDARTILEQMFQMHLPLKYKAFSTQYQVEHNAQTIKQNFAINIPDKIRIDWNENQYTWVKNNNTCLYKSPQEFTNHCPSYFDWITHLSSHQNSQESTVNHWLDLLKQHNIDTNIVTLGFQEINPIYIIGAHATEPYQPQIWIDLNTLSISYVCFEQNLDNKPILTQIFMSPILQSTWGNMPEQYRILFNGIVFLNGHATRHTPSAHFSSSLFDTHQIQP